MSYYFSKTLSLPFKKAVEHVTETLKAEGFGIVSTVDVKEAMKKKLNVDFRNYLILGACNPPFAYKALQLEDKIGVFLPCNVVVQEHADGRVEAVIVDPAASMAAVNNPQLAEVAAQVRERLQRAARNL